MRWTDLSPAERRAVRWPHPAAVATDLLGARWKNPPHIDFISRTLRNQIAAKDGRLILTVPPRHGKSELCSVWLVVWFLSMKPTARVAVISYGIVFARKWGRKIRAVIREHGPALGLTINPEKDAAGELELLEGGSVLCTGIDGTLTGHGFDLVIVDDPHKNRAEAESQVKREAVIEFWQGTARNRFEPGGSAVTIMQRWHESDLVGFLLSEESGEDWHLINFPALAEEEDVLGRKPGEALWPDRYGKDALEGLRASIGSYNWASQYQQRPSPAGGAVFQSKHFRYFEEKKEEGFYLLKRPDADTKRVRVSDCYRIQTADTAMTDKTTSDWTVCGTFAITPDCDLLVLEIDRARLQVPDQLGWLIARRMSQGPVWQGVEEKSSGIGLLQAAARRGTPFKPLKAETNKVIRAAPAATMYENGLIYHRAAAPWLGDFEAELTMFPMGSHDDQVDVLAYAAREVEKPAPSIMLL